jgi:arabinofuranan 3-O-arabinosyltransferase
LRDDKGATERAGQTLPDPYHESYRLNVFPGSGDNSRTLVEQRGGIVDATADGGTNRPEDRAAYAFDGDPRTAWRVGGADPTGQELVLHPDRPTRADHVTLVQPQNGTRNRVLSRVTITVNNRSPITVDLGPESLTAGGQVVRFPSADVRRLAIRTVAATQPSFNPGAPDPVGFAEVELNHVHVTETVRLPVDLAKRARNEAGDHALDYVLSRLRYDPSDSSHQDQELSLRRRLVVPDARAFGLSGTVRVNPNAPDPVLDTVLGTTAAGATFTSSAHLRGDADARASRAFDGQTTTAWTAPLGDQGGQWVGVDLAAPVTVQGLELGVVADGQHSIPTQMHLEIDGQNVRTLTLPPIPDSAPGGRVAVPVSFAPVTGGHLRLVVDQYRAVDPDGTGAVEPQTLPLSFTDVGISGVPVPAASGSIADTCRSDLVRVDGAPVPVRITGSVTEARSGLRVEACDGALHLTAGSHTVTSATGLDGGIDVDRVVLSSSASGAATGVAPRGATLDAAGATVKVVDAGSTSAQVKVTTDGSPFWLVFGQSHSDGWEASTSGGRLGPHQLVDGYANGWLVQPDHAGTVTIDLRWTPQRIVWIGFAISALAVAICLTLIVRTWRARRSRRGGTAEAASKRDAPMLDLSFAYGESAAPVVSAVSFGFGVTLLVATWSRLWIGLVAGALALAAGLVPRSRLLVAAAIPLALVASRVVHEPELAWLSIALLVVDLGGRWMHRRRTAWTSGHDQSSR